MNKPLPPYGSKLKQFLNTGNKPKNNIWLFCGLNSWSKARKFQVSQLTLCLPPIVDPETYSWDLISGLRPLVIDTGEVRVNTLRKLAYLLLSSGALSVHVIPHGSSLIVYRRDDNEYS